jgi:hypothetical protein
MMSFFDQIYQFMDWSSQSIYIINLKLPNLKQQPQGVSNREREREQHCQIKQDFRVAKKAETPNILNL